MLVNYILLILEFLLRTFIIFLLLLFLGLLLEKSIHPKWDLALIASQLKRDIQTIWTKLFKKPQPRHIFSWQLFEELKKVLLPYSNSAFEILINLGMVSRCPCIQLVLIPSQELTAGETSKISNLLLVKFRQYLRLNGLSWNTFSDFITGENSIAFFLHYSELPEDLKGFKFCYQKKIAEKASTQKHTCVDEELEKELTGIDN